MRRAMAAAGGGCTARGLSMSATARSRRSWPAGWRRGSRQTDTSDAGAEAGGSGVPSPRERSPVGVRPGALDAGLRGGQMRSVRVGAVDVVSDGAGCALCGFGSGCWRMNDASKVVKERTTEAAWRGAVLNSGTAEWIHRFVRCPHIGETCAAGGLHHRTPEGQPRGHRRRGARPGDGAPPFPLKLHLSQVDALTAAVQQVEHQADEVLRPFSGGRRPAADDAGGQ